MNLSNTAEALRRSVIAVPPLARRADLTLDREQNARLLGHLRAGGVRTFMYGGNANLYHLPVSEYAALLELLDELAADGDWFIPGIGSDFGKARDQLEILRGTRFPTALVLPHRFPARPGGVATGLRRLAEAFGAPLIAYLKDDGAIEADDLARLVDDGAICAIKYAIVRAHPEDDPFLEKLLALLDPARVVSGIGERPLPVHWERFGLRSFTSGSVCIAPALSTSLRDALARGDRAAARDLHAAFLPLEDLRDRHSPILVLHEAVRLAGIADTGPLLPYLENLTDSQILHEIAQAATALHAASNPNVTLSLSKGELVEG